MREQIEQMKDGDKLTFSFVTVSRDDSRTFPFGISARSERPFIIGGNRAKTARQAAKHVAFYLNLAK